MRNLSGPNITASRDATVRPVFFAELDFASGATRVNSSIYDLSFDPDGGSPPLDRTFLGVGVLGTISGVEESGDLKSRAIQLSLRGVPRDLVVVSLTEHYHGRAARLWVGLLDENHALIDTPALLFGGLMDTMDTEMGKESKITMTVLDRFSRWDTASDIRYTDEQQQARFPGDKGLEFISQVPQKEIFLNPRL